MDRILIILKKENGPMASSAPALGLNFIIIKHVYWYMQQMSGERLQDHWSSGFFFSSFHEWMIFVIDCFVSGKVQCMNDCLYCYSLMIIQATTRENRSSGFQTRPDTNRHVQSQKKARILKFCI